MHMLPMAPQCFHGLGREGGEGREGKDALRLLGLRGGLPSKLF